MRSLAVPATGADESGQSGVRARIERILHVEDDLHVRRAIAFAFNELRCEGVATIAQAKERMATEHHFAWVVDVHLPDGSGLDLLEWARGQGMTTPAIVVTADENAVVVRRTQLLGVELAYKPDLRANLRAFLERARDARAVVPAVRLSVDRFAVQYRLSDREREIVRATARGVPRAELDAALGVSENTIKTLIRRILRKTAMQSVDDVLRAILAARDEPSGVR